MTYAEIEAEVARIIASNRRPLPPHAAMTFAAFLQDTSGLAVTEHCPYCGGQLSVTQCGRAWSVSCPCGRSHDSFRGL